MRITLQGVTELRARIAGIRGRLANFGPGLMRAALVVLKFAQQNIAVGGPGWAPNLSGTPLLRRTGRLINSLALGGDGNVDDINGMSIRVGTNVPYAKWLQDGTGVYAGHGPIRPRNGRALAFESGGQTFVRRSVKGVPSRPYLYITDPVAQRVMAVWQSFLLDDTPGPEVA